MRRLIRKRREERDDQGAVAIIVAVLVLALLVFVAIALDTGKWYIAASRVQNAADAAAMAGVTWLPANYPGAQAAAQALAEDNGFGPSSVTTFRPTNSQLGVTVSTTVNNVFGSMFGNPTTPITRSAVADFQAPTIMGSPCNALGNQPASTTGKPARPPGTVIPTEAQGGYATCQDPPGFWLRIAGPATAKENGDRYATKYCGAAAAKCTGSGVNRSNDEYPSLGVQGYYFTLRVKEGAVGRPLTVQIYDPSYIDGGVSCTNLSTATDGMNPYVPTGQLPTGENRARDRYGSINSPNPPWTTTPNRPNPFCNGDNAPGSAGPGTPREGFYTSFIVRAPTSSYNPANGAPISGCTKQYGFQTTGPSVNQLTSSDTTNYDLAVAKTYHQWVDLCTIPADQVVKGDYYVQVRTNLKVPAGMTIDTAGVKTTSSGVVTKDTNVYRVTDGGGNSANPVAAPVSGTLDETRFGHNIFSLRIATSAAGADSIGAAVAISGFERFPIYSNANGVQEMNLIQVPESTTGDTFDFTFFDVSDYSGNATLKVEGPKGSLWENGLTGCSLTGVTTTSGTDLANCSVTVRGGDNNGKIGTMTVPIPNTYECTAGDVPALGDCWMRVVFTIAAGANEDTTWDAGINGDPVRLVE